MLKTMEKFLSNISFFTLYDVQPMHRMLLSFSSKYIPKLATSYNHHSYELCPRHYLICIIVTSLAQSLFSTQQPE